MRPSASRRFAVGGVLIGSLFAGFAVAQAPAGADKINQAISATQDSNRASAASQQRINVTDDATRAMLERYRAATWQAQQLGVYGKQLEQLLGAQEAEKASLRQQLVDSDRTERELIPLMLRMLDTLDRFVTLDLPFLKQERRERVDGLRRMMAEPDTPVAEKYRRLLEAYQVEIEYGRTFGAERAQVDDREVDLLRVGRASLFYLTLDGDEAGAWNAATKKWVVLPGRYRSSIKKGLRIAHEVSAPTLLDLPMPLPVASAPVAAAGAAK